MKYDVKDGIATITLDRPETLNSLTFEIYAQLRDQFIALQNDASVHVVIITGAGRAFCSGGSVTEIIGPLLEMDAAARLEFTRMTGDLIRAIRALRKPVIAAVNGVAVGAGAVIALASDFRVMADSAKLGFLFVKVGLAGADMGAAWLLPQMVGLARATEILMLGESLTAQQCKDYGLANSVFAAEQVVPEAQKLARRLADGPRFAIGMTKEMLNREPTMSLEEAIEAEAQAQQICMDTQDFKRAHDAFIKKQQPKFEGN